MAENPCGMPSKREVIWMQRYLFQNIDRPTEMTKYLT
jgi:hypothetical protein